MIRDTEGARSNRAVDTIALWPKVIAQIEARYDWYALPRSAFAPEFAEDLLRRREAVTSPDPTDPTSPRPIKLVTALDQERQILRFASAIVLETGRDPKTIKSIADVVEPDAAKAALNFKLKRLRQRDKSAETSMEIHVGAGLLVVLAKHYVKASPEDLEILRGLARRLKPKNAQQMTKKNRELLRRFEDEKTIAKFIAAPSRVSAEILKRKQLRRVDSARLQAALGAAILMVAPVRSKNLGKIRFEHNLIRVGTGHNESFRLYFPADEVKNTVELEFELNGTVKELLQVYLDRARPLIADPKSDYLFPGRGTNGIVPAHLSGSIARMMSKEIGIRIAAHQFRHVAGHLFLAQNPGAYEIVRQFLGHKKLSTTVDFYAGMEMRTAANLLDQHISKRREDLAGKGPFGMRRRRGKRG
ncbi:MAG: site-specific integrase [Alphaproteobacteria bacterium]|nr:site-specific integrase [Alphaproteobacteria bacterium]